MTNLHLKFTDNKMYYTEGSLHQIHQLIFENIHDAIAIYSLADYSSKYTNLTTSKILGYTKDELSNMTLFDPIHSEDRVWMQNKLKSTFTLGHFKNEVRYLRKDGISIWLEVKGTVSQHENEEGVLICTLRDVSEYKRVENQLRKTQEELETLVRKRTEKLLKVNIELENKIKEMKEFENALRNSENYYKTMFENNGTATVLVNKELRIIAANYKAEQLTGYSREDLIGLNPFENFVTEEYLPIVKNNYVRRQVDPRNAPQDYEIECVDANGKTMTVIMNVSPIPESENMVVSILDITDQHRYQEEVQSSERRFRTLFEDAPFGIGISRDDKVLFANRACRQMFGYDENTDMANVPIEKCFISISSDESKSKSKENSSDLIQGNSLEVKGRRFNGSTFPLYIQYDTISLNDGPAYLCFLKDISVQKKSEDRIRRQINAQNLLLEIAKEFTFTLSDDIDLAINLALKKIGEFEKTDRSYIFLYSNDRKTMSNSHEWCAEGIIPEIQLNQALPVECFPYWMTKLKKYKNICINNLDDLPKDAANEKEHLEKQGIQSLLVIPMVYDDKLIGFMGYDAVRIKREWTEDSIVILEFVAQIISKELQRKANAEEIESSKNYYQTIFENTGAATMIIEDDMTISMANQKCSELISIPRESILGLKWTGFIPEHLLPQMKKNHRLRRMDTQLAPDRYKTQIITTQGHRREGILEVSMIPGSKKSVATFMDMTDFTRMDRAYSSISSVNIAMIQAGSERDLLETVCKMIVKKCGYCLAWVGYVKDDESRKVEVIVSAGNDRGYTDRLDIALSDPHRSNGPTGRAIKLGKSIICKDFQTDSKVAYWAPDAIERGFKSSIAIPLKNHSQAFGAINIYSTEKNVFNQEEVKLLSDMANNLSFAIVSLQTRENLKRANEKLEQNLEKMQRLLLQSVTSLGNVIGIRDPYTAGHQKKVARLAVAIGHELGLPKDKLDSIEVASSLHDIGKLSIPGEILNKPGHLTPLELEMIKTHTNAGYKIIRDIEFPWPIADIILQHHERMDGSGYPIGLSGEEIMLESRIIAVADVVDSMATHRPFRAAMGIKKALSEIETNRGKLYDARVVDACLHLFREKRFRHS